uniref:Uncharacterized protein n=1 Tax=Panagrolaimus sp. PS1159 TaxID=55785 RepID=A0AC35FWM9_9BILA
MASSLASSEKSNKFVTLTKKFSRSDLHPKTTVAVAATPLTNKYSHASENPPPLLPSNELEENEKLNASSSSSSKRQRSTKRSLRLSVFRKKVGSENRGSNDKNNARRTTSLGPNTIKEETAPPEKKIKEAPVKKKSKEVSEKKIKEASEKKAKELASPSKFPYPKSDTKVKKGFCCSFRQLSRKRLIDPDSTLSVQEPCTILTPEYGPLGTSKGNSRNSTAPNSPKPESSIMPTTFSSFLKKYVNIELYLRL